LLDKAAEDPTTEKEIIEMYNSQLKENRARALLLLALQDSQQQQKNLTSRRLEKPPRSFADFSWDC